MDDSGTIPSPVSANKISSSLGGVGRASRKSEAITGTSPGKRHADDYYPTPRDVTERIFDKLHLPSRCRVLDPFAGTGDILAVASSRGLRCAGVELDAGRATEAFMVKHCYSVLIADTLSLRALPACDAIVTNPPYKLALECMQACVASEAPVVAMLLRTNILESRKRAAFWRKHAPSALYALSKRPSFTGNGKTDGTGYAWFVWDRRPLLIEGTQRIEVLL